MRIHITGNAGSGKTTLARRLGAEFGLPVFSLDSIVWQPGWKKTPPDERSAAERRLVSQPEWVIDGVSEYVRAHADLVVFLDVPEHVCAWRGLVRALRYFHRTRPGLPAPCPDIVIVPRLLGLIHRFSKRGTLQLRLEAAADAHRFHTERHPVRSERVVRCARLALARAGASSYVGPSPST